MRGDQESTQSFVSNSLKTRLPIPRGQRGREDQGTTMPLTMEGSREVGGFLSSSEPFSLTSCSHSA